MDRFIGDVKAPHIDGEKLYKDGVEVTATAAELNILDGVTSTAAELNILDGVTATATELNYLDIASLGTGAASKAVVLDSGDDYTWPAAGVLTYGGSAINATGSEINAAADQSSWAALNPAADDALTLSEHGTPTKCILMSSADGDTFTLPAAAGTGARFVVIVSTTVTSNNHIIQCVNATDEFLGVVYQVDTDTTDTVAAYPCLDADGFDTITMDGSTQGGLKGDRFELIDVAAGHWNLVGYINATGTVASPLSAAVS